MARYSYPQLAKQLEDAIANNMKDMVNSRAKLIEKRCLRILKDFLDHAGGFHNVTGNTINGLAVAAYYNGVQICVVTTAELGKDAPTRASLKAGEEYDLPRYYDGTKAKRYIGRGSDGKARMSRPFRGTIGEGNYHARAVAVLTADAADVKARIPRKGLSFAIISASNLTEYLERRDEVSLIRDFRYRKASSKNAQVTEVLRHKI